MAAEKIPPANFVINTFDTFQLGNRAESEAMFDQWLVKTELMMHKNEDVF